MAWPSGSGRRPCSSAPPSDRTRTTRPGMPTTVELSGTGCTTTEPAPILTLSPMRMLPSTLAPVPTTTLIADGGMALALLAARAAQRDALVQQHVVADFGGLADHHAHAVIDEEAAADGGAGVDFDAGEKAADLRNHARQQRHVPAVQPVRQAVRQDGVKARDSRGRSR